ncbi:MAG: hypothetical protein GX956_02235 [Firmicutes bacterium]|nr:hypothetical protein [Bacillota bacterium]
MRTRLGFLVILIVLVLVLSSPWCVQAFEAEDLPFGFGNNGWQAGLSLTQENIKPLGFFGYEKTGIGGYLSHTGGEDDQLSSWFGGHKQVLVGNIGYTLELFVANTQRPILSTFINNVDPHIGAYGEFNRMYGDVGHGLTGTAQLFVTELGQFEYTISPYVQFTRQGIWRFSISLGGAFGMGLSYLEPMEKLKFDVTLVNEELSFHVLLSMPERPTTFGAGWTENKIQAFVRYSF